MEQRVVSVVSKPPSSGLLDRAPTRSRQTEGKVRIWIREHRPPFSHDGRNWFVILSAVCIGMALVIEPVYFIGLGIAFALLGWWRRESARAGLRDVVIGAFIAGGIALIAAIAWYIGLQLFAG